MIIEMIILLKNLLQKFKNKYKKIKMTCMMILK